MPEPQPRLIEKKIQALCRGLDVPPFRLSGLILPKARFKEEVNLEIFLGAGRREKHLMFAKIFKGRPPYYRPWIELFDIRPVIETENGSAEYFQSELETSVLTFFAQALKPAENLFVEYYRDSETFFQLQRNIPAPASRLGYRLFRLGFSWFKDWYFPEGFMEGDQKLQGEKAMNPEAASRHQKQIREELKTFINNPQIKQSDHRFIRLALARAEQILKQSSE